MNFKTQQDGYTKFVYESKEKTFSAFMEDIIKSEGSSNSGRKNVCDVFVGKGLLSGSEPTILNRILKESPVIDGSSVLKRIFIKPMETNEKIGTISKEDIAEVLSPEDLNEHFFCERNKCIRSPSDIEAYYNEEINNQHQRIYFFNIPPTRYAGMIETLQDKLEPFKAQNHIHPETNSNLAGDNLGLNTSMFYVAGSKSYSEIHIEDGHLASINGVHCLVGEQDDAAIAKLWLIVPAESGNDVRKMLRAEMPSQCAFHVNHKSTFVSPGLLESHKIPYTFVPQYPGDVLFLKPGVFHQVFNINPNLAEAINFGTAEHIIAAKHMMVCTCDENRVENIEAPTGQVVLVTAKKISSQYICKEEGCTLWFTTKKEIAKHHDMKHSDIPSPYKRVFQPEKCEVCDVEVSRMAKHKKSKKHETKFAESDVGRSSNATITCTRCKGQFLPGEENVHKSVCPGGQNICHCGKKFVRLHDLRRHESKHASTSTSK